MANYGTYGNGLTLKALLENPDLQNPPVLNDAEKDKKDGDVLYDSGLAFLGPNLWDKTYSTEDFNLEYMDLDEFLGENGIPVNLDNIVSTDISSIALSPDSEASNTVASENSANLVQSSPASPSKQSPKHANDLKLPISPAPSSAPTTLATTLSPPVVSPSKASPIVLPASRHEKAQSSSPPKARMVASPHHSSRAGTPNVEFVISKEDIALVSTEGQDNFDPRCRAFSEEELKPQPMIKKSRKVFVSDDAKDDKYWQRRKKNNYAAKRSRDARRIKENQIAMRASFLEKENDALIIELEKVKKENLKLKTSLAKYEPTDGV